MSVTATELKKDLSKYLKAAENEDVYITKNGKVIAVLVSPNKKAVESLDSLFGIIPSDVDEMKLKDERIKKL